MGSGGTDKLGVGWGGMTAQRETRSGVGKAGGEMGARFLGAED